MTRLRVARLTGTKSIDRVAVANRNNCIAISKSFLALIVVFSLLTTPLWATPSSWLGTIVYADRARFATGQASVGATIFSGDRLST
ncbi:MAG TPA: hypothetical protein VE822_08080, partial [Candidatus Elarobacter sp.]|nr:hypothetical protein [Candidatus Elarobacter sp.]